MENEKFDLVINGLAFSLFHLGLAPHFHCPSIILSTLPAVRTTNVIVGQPADPATIPTFPMKALINGNMKMNFFERLLNMILTPMEVLLDTYVDYENSKIYNQNFPSDKYPTYGEAKKSVALVLINSHFSQTGTRPYLQNVIEVGGMHIQKEPSPLPTDIKNWIEGSKDGVVLVSFGTNYKSSDLSEEKLAMFLNNFKRLKQRVLWKFEDESIQNLPKNVMIKKWVPQNDVLAHPNTKLFISHMGIGGYTEAMYHAVPVVAIPFAADQHTNSDNAKTEGWAEVIPIFQLSEKSLEQAIDLVLNNPKYKQSVQQLSTLYRDRPMHAIDTAIYWIEYVIRYNGAPQLQYAGRDLNFFQSNSLDVFGFLAVLIYVTFKILSKMGRKFKAICFGSNKVSLKSNKNKNE